MQLDSHMLCRAAGGRLMVGEHHPLGPISIDSRTTPPGAVFFCIRGPRFDGHRFAGQAVDRGATVVVADRRGVTALPGRLLDGDATVIVVSDAVRALGRLAATARVQFRGAVIALTGSSGKTTTKEMIAAVLNTAGPTLATEGNLNNHLGVPLTLLRMAAPDAPDYRYAVVEMGMNAPGEISYLASLAGPQVGVITSVGAAHLAGLGSIEAIARAKGELFGALPRQGLAIMPSRVPYPWIVTENLRAPLLCVGEREVDPIRLSAVKPTDDGIAGTVHVGGARHRLQLKLDGRHNLRNALLAIAVGRKMGVGVEQAIAALQQVEPPSMRGEIRALPDGSPVVLDCYNANPQSMAVAIRTFADRAPDGLLVLGDMLELGPDEGAAHRALGEAVATLPGSPTLIGVGPLSEAMIAGARAAGLSPERAVHARDAQAAAERVSGLRRSGQSILLKGSRGMRLERVFELLSARGEEGPAR